MAMVNEFKIKRDICEIGRRLYDKGFAAANDGNISVRISDQEVLTTPTLISKGFMTPDDICKVDMSGRQLTGRRKRTSEVLVHLEIYKQNPNVKSVVHCHPPHATAFSVAGEEIPSCVLPEVEVFLGTIPTAVYETPGGQGLADTLLPHIARSKIAVLKNHGTVAWGESVEQAYWWTEILDAYCRILLLAKQVGRVERINEPKMQELLDLKERFGQGVDPRRLENCDLCVNVDFGRGFVSPDPGNPGKESKSAMTPPPSQAPTSGQISDGDMERLVQDITNRIMLGWKTS